MNNLDLNCSNGFLQITMTIKDNQESQCFCFVFLVFYFFLSVSIIQNFVLRAYLRSNACSILQLLNVSDD